jgi:hypothetical protein
MLKLGIASRDVNMQKEIHAHFEEVGDDMVTGDFEDLKDMVVLKKDFKNSINTILQRLEQIPDDLDVHEVVLKNEFTIMGDNLKHEIAKEVGTVLKTVLAGTALAPTLGHSVDNRVSFLPSTPLGLVTQMRLPNGLNSLFFTNKICHASTYGHSNDPEGYEYAT